MTNVFFFRYDKSSLEEAYKYLLDRRPIAAPNHGFLIELIRYEKELQDKNQHTTDDNKSNSTETTADPSVVITKI